MRERRIRPERYGLPSEPEGRISPAARVHPARGPAAGSPHRGPRGRSAVLAVLIVPVFLVVGSAGRGQDGAEGSKPAPPAPDESRLKAFVEMFAAPELEGRRGAGGRKAASLVVDEFRRLKLQPLFSGGFEQPIPGKEPGQVQGRNVGAVLRGSDPALRDQWVIVSAHFDHLGKKGDVVYPGADDNASGVAMMLEVARSLSSAPKPFRRSLMFVGFDLEEVGLFGSRYFVAHPPVPLEKIALFITADMIGRSFAGIREQRVFVMGTEHAPGLRPCLDQAAHDQPVKLGLLGSDLLLLNRSDYGPFRTRKVPYLFFSTGENPLYHSPEDKPETLDYPKLTAISRVIHQVAARVADQPDAPRWTDSPEHPLAEAITLRDVLVKLLDNEKPLGLSAAATYLIRNTLKTLEEIIARGAITPSERAGVIQAARLVLLLIQH